MIKISNELNNTKNINAMKDLKLILPLIILILVISACNDDENDDPAMKTSNWSFALTFNITDPDTYSFDAGGTATADETDTEYTITANYSIGNADFSDVVIEGVIENDLWDFTNKTLQIDFQNGDIQFTEIINFSITDLTMDGGTATGTGDITIENVEAGTTESGTIEFTAHAMLPE